MLENEIANPFGKQLTSAFQSLSLPASFFQNIIIKWPFQTLKVMKADTAFLFLPGQQTDASDQISIFVLRYRCFCDVWAFYEHLRLLWLGK